MEEQIPSFTYDALASLGDRSSEDDEDYVSENFLDTENELLPSNSNYVKSGLDLATSPPISQPGTVINSSKESLHVGEEILQKLGGGTSTRELDDTMVIEQQEEMVRCLRPERAAVPGVSSTPKVTAISILSDSETAINISSDSETTGFERDGGADMVEADVEYFSLELEEHALPEKEKTIQRLQTSNSVKRTAPVWTPLELGGISCIQSPYLQLHQEIVNFCEFISPTQEEQQERVAAIQRVRDVVMSIWPDCKVMVFGSSATGLFLPTSDADVVILDSGCEVPQNGLKAIATSLRRRSMVKNIQVIGKARVPIVKFVEVKSKISFDISFDVSNGPNAVEFIKEAIAALPPLKPLCMVLKMFLQQRELNEVYTGGLGSYALLVMLLTHLQMHPSRHVYDNYFVHRNVLEENLGVLLTDFLDLYGRALNVRDVGISCREGGRFFSKRSRGFVDTKRPYLLSVEDPQAPENDIGKNSFNIQKVRSAFTLAHRLLTSPSTMDTSASPGILGRIVRLDSHLEGRKLLGPGRILQFVDDEQADYNHLQPVESHGGEFSDEKGDDQGHVAAEVSQRNRKRHRHKSRNELKTNVIEARDQKGHRFDYFEEDFPRGYLGSPEVRQNPLKRKKQETRKTLNIPMESNKGVDEVLPNEYKPLFSHRTPGNNQLSQSAAMWLKQKGGSGKERSDIDRYSDFGGPDFVGREAKVSRKRKRDRDPGNYSTAHTIVASSRTKRKRTVSDDVDRGKYGHPVLRHKEGDASTSMKRKESFKAVNNSKLANWSSNHHGRQGKHAQQEFSRRDNFSSENAQLLGKGMSKVAHPRHLVKRKSQGIADLPAGGSLSHEVRESKHHFGTNSHTKGKKDKSHWENVEHERSHHSRRVMKTPSHTKYKYC